MDLILCFSETEDDLIFESKPSLKVASCRLPFHIAFHNYVCTKSDLKFQILTYEPIQVETIYKDFRELGFKYHIDVSITNFSQTSEGHSLVLQTFIAFQFTYSLVGNQGLC